MNEVFTHGTPMSSAYKELQPASFLLTLSIGAQVLAGNEHTCSLFRHVTSSQDELLADHSGEARGRIMQSVLKEAACQSQAG